MYNLLAALIIAFALVLAAFVVCGRYTALTGEKGSAFVVDRFTGSVAFCLGSQCYLVKPFP